MWDEVGWAKRKHTLTPILSSVTSFSVFAWAAWHTESTTRHTTAAHTAHLLIFAHNARSVGLCLGVLGHWRRRGDRGLSGEALHNPQINKWLAFSRV